MEQTNKLTTKKVVVILASIFVICGVALGGLIYARNSVKTVAPENKYGYVNPDETKADTDEGITIDGVLDETQYQNNNWLYLHNQKDGADVDIAMTSYFGEKGMYFVYDVTEGNPIYVNKDRASYLNSCIEMYLAPSTSTRKASNSVFEIDMLPTGDMTFKKSNGVSGYVNVATTKDIMACLGATTKGGAVNTKDCYGYYLELFIPWDYMEYLDLDADAMREGFVYVDPAHITSFNETGTDLDVDRYWYYFSQQHGATFADVYQNFRFDENGAMGTVSVSLAEGEHYSIEGDKSVIPGMKSQVTITPEEGYALKSILIDGKESIQNVSYNEDGSVVLSLLGEKEGHTISAVAEAVVSGNKTLSGQVKLHKLGGDSLKDVEISYMGPTGEKPVEMDANGKFTLPDLKQGYYTITVEKEGYEKFIRKIDLKHDVNTELTLEYPTFTTETGYSYVLDNQNDNVLNRFGSRGAIISKDSYNKFTVESYFKYDEKLAKEAEHDHFTQQRAGIRIKFSNEKYWHIDILKEKETYKVAYAKHSGDNSVFGWKSVYKLSEEEIAKYQSEKGIKLEVQRDGQYAAIYLNEKLIAVEVLDSEYAKYTAQVGFESWIANRIVEEIPYKITANTEKNIKNVYFKRPTEWDITGQFDGYVTLPKDHDGDSGWLKFDKKYVDVDVTLTARDYDGSNTDERMALQFNFGDKRTICVTITNDANKAGDHIVQTMGDTIFGWKKLYTLTDEQVAKYQSKDGIQMRIIRQGTVAMIYLDGVHICDADLTVDKDGKATGITAKTEADVAFRNYGNKGYQVDVPFTVSEKKVETVAIELKASNKGTPVTDKLLYQPGETVVLSGKGVDGYYCTGLFVNGAAVPLNWDGTYTFVANEKQYIIEGAYHKRVFVDPTDSTNVLWDITKQNQKTVVLPNGGTQISGKISAYSNVDNDKFNTLKFYDSYKDMDLRLTIKDAPNTNSSTIPDTRIWYQFGDNELQLSVTELGGDVVIRDLNSSMIGKRLYKFTEAQENKYKSDTGVELGIVRTGNRIFFFIDGEECAIGKLAHGNDDRYYKKSVINLSTLGDKKITKDTKATVLIRRWGDAETWVDMPFSVANKVTQVAVTVDVKPTTNGTVVMNTAEYIEGAHATFTVTPDEGYYMNSLNVKKDGNKVSLDKKHNIDGGTYSFETEEGSYIVEATFAKKVFVTPTDSTNTLWDVTKQNQKIETLANGGTKISGTISAVSKKDNTNFNTLNFCDSYKDMDLTLTVKDDPNTKSNTATETRVFFTFGSKQLQLSVTEIGGDVVIRDYAGLIGKRLYKFTDAQENKYKSDEGVELRIVRVGTQVYLYIDGTECAIGRAANGGATSYYEGTEINLATLSNNAITADTEATVLVRRWGDAGTEIEMPFRVVNKVTPVEVSVENTTHGTVTTNSRHYFAGDTVTFTVTPEESCYCSNLEVKKDSTVINLDKEINMAGGTYSFVAEEGNYTIEASFATGKIFRDVTDSTYTLWNLMQQNQGSVTLTNGRTGIKGVISATTKAGAGTDNDALYFNDEYTDMDLTLTVKNDNTTTAGSTPETIFVFDFGSGKVLRISITEIGGEAIIRTTDGILSWKRLYRLSDEQKANYKSSKGVELRIVRKGTQIYLGVDGVACAIGAAAHDNDTRYYAENNINLATLSGNVIKEDTPATVSIRRYGDEGKQIDMPFTVCSEVKELFTTGWKTDNTCWDSSKQYIDMLSLKKTCTNNKSHGTYFGTKNAYDDVDFSVRVKEATYGTTTSSASIQFNYNDKTTVKFWLQTDGDIVKITARTVASDNKNTNNADWRIYTLSSAEATKYKAEGIDWRIVRQGTEFIMYIDGQGCQLLSNGIVENNKIVLEESGNILATNKVSLAFVYNHPKDANVNVDFPYKLYTSVK